MTWATLGLPTPQVDGYGYTIDAGIERSSMETAHPRQYRKYRTNRRTFTVAFVLDQAQLALAETFFGEVGYSWFPLTLIAGDGIGEYCVRCTSDYAVAPLMANLFSAKVTLENALSGPVGGSCAACNALPEVACGNGWPTCGDGPSSESCPPDETCT